MLKKEDNGLLKRNISDLQRCSVWPRKGKQSIFARILKSIVYFFGLFMPITAEFADLVRQLLGYRDNMDQLLQSINQGLSVALLFGCLIGFHVKRNRIMKQVDSLRDVGINQIPADSDETDNRTNLYTKIGYRVVLLGFLMYTSIPFMFWDACQKKRETEVYMKYMPCGFFTSIWYPFDFSEFPMYIIALGGLNFMGYYYSSTATTIIIFQAAIILHILSHIKNLKNKLKILNQSKRQDILSECVQYHQALISYCSELSDNFSFIACWILLIGTFIISVVACQLLMSDSTADNVRMGFYLMPTIMLFFFLNLTGQLLTNESISLSDAIYELDWFNFPVPLQKDIKFMLLRAQQPLTLAAGPINQLSLETFSSIMSSAYSFVTLLANFKH